MIFSLLTVYLLMHLTRKEKSKIGQSKDVFRPIWVLKYL